jgi:hypothetical protein
MARSLGVVIWTWTPRVVERLSVESIELVDVPRVADVVAFKCLEAIGVWYGHLCD